VEKRGELAQRNKKERLEVLPNQRVGEGVDRGLSNPKGEKIGNCHVGVSHIRRLKEPGGVKSKGHGTKKRGRPDVKGRIHFLKENECARG